VQWLRPYRPTGAKKEILGIGMLYVVMDIGCIECREPSHCVGIFTDKQQALEAAGQLSKYMQIFPVSELNQIQPESSE
jgi:hypothetical protein